MKKAAKSAGHNLFEASKSNLPEFEEQELPSNYGSILVQDQLLGDKTRALQVIISAWRVL